MIRHLSRCCEVQLRLDGEYRSLPNLLNRGSLKLMRRLLLTALLTALIVGVFAGVASARLVRNAPAASQPAPAPFVVPSAMPTKDPVHPGAFGYRDGASIGVDIERAAGAAPDGASRAGSTVEVTATVLPVVLLIVDGEDQVVRVSTNTTERNGDAVLFQARSGSVDGEITPITPGMWRAARVALARAHAGDGVIWSR